MGVGQLLASKEKLTTGAVSHLELQESSLQYKPPFVFKSLCRFKLQSLEYRRFTTYNRKLGQYEFSIQGIASNKCDQLILRPQAAQYSPSLCMQISLLLWSEAVDQSRDKPLGFQH